MRQPRFKARPEAPVGYYHCVSRVVDRLFIFGEQEKEHFRQWMRLYEQFCQVRILTYCLMSNHFHLLIEVPRRPEEVPSDAVLLGQLKLLYPERKVAAVREQLERLPAVEAHRVRERYFRRMWDLSQFMKPLKQRFTQWYNRRPVRDFAPLGRIVRIPWAFAVNSQLPVATVPELVGYARAHPGKLTYASAGVTSVQNLAVEMMKASYGIDMVHVPYKGSGPALTDVIAGGVNFIIADLSVLKPHARSGEVRLLATTGPHRTRAAPELPTVIEQGLSGYVVESWNALVVPSGTPPDVVAYLQRALRQTLNTREVIEELEQLGFEPLDEDAQVLARLLPIEVERFSQTVKRLAIHAGQ